MRPVETVLSATLEELVNLPGKYGYYDIEVGKLSTLAYRAGPIIGDILKRRSSIRYRLTTTLVRIWYRILFGTWQ